MNATGKKRQDDSMHDHVEGRRVMPRRVTLPGFLIEEEVGLGDVIKRATGLAGLRPCGGCGRRAAALNRAVVFSPRRRGR
jgi:hypothetical protein